MPTKSIRPAMLKAMTVPLIATAFFVVVIAVTPGSEWLKDVLFFLGFSFVLGSIGTPSLFTRVDLGSDDELTVRWFGIIRHKFHARDALSLNIDRPASYPRFLGIFSYDGMAIIYKKVGTSDNGKVFLRNSFYKINDLRTIAAFMAEHGSEAAAKGLRKSEI